MKQHLSTPDTMHTQIYRIRKFPCDVIC